MNAVTAERRKPAPDIAAEALRCSNCQRLQHEHAHVDTPGGREYFCPDPAGEVQRLAFVRALQDAAATSSGTAGQHAGPDPGVVDIAAGDTAPAEVDESPPDTDRTEIPWQAVDALASSERTLTAAEPTHRALIFMRASTEIMRLVDRDSAPAAWLQIVDDLDAMGRRHKIDPAAVQTLMAAATEAPPDQRPGAAQPAPDSAPPQVEASLQNEYPESADGLPDHEPMNGASTVVRPPLALICPPAWRDVPLPPMRWLATHRIPAGDATILSGDGGGGKTTVALQLAIAVERGLGDWLGTTIESGPVIFFSGEEPTDEMRRRLGRVARKRGIEPGDIDGLHFHFADPAACLLGIARSNGPIVPTPLFDSLRAAALEIRPVLIVVDSIAATFGGNQNDRVHARSFVGMFRRLAHDVDCAVLLLDHPSLSGITSGTGRGGSMDWQNATRARLHLETVDDTEGGADRVLEVKKTNYGPFGEKVKLRWEDGCFVMQGETPAPARAAAEAVADQAYLDCLDIATVQGRNVFEATGRSYAPAVFAAMPEVKVKGISARAFVAAQERLLSAGLIWNEPYGPPSRNSRHLARKSATPPAEAAK
jgi:RecA-family ATPase